MKDFNVYSLLEVIKHTFVKDCFVICVGTLLLLECDQYKEDLINRLKQSEPHNILTYEVEMTCHMALHNDILGRIHTILKQDDYFRTLEELPVIDGLHAYNDIQLFPKLFYISAVIERVTSEADLIEKQLDRMVCTHFHKLLCHVLLVSSLGPVQHSDLSCWLHHHL